MADKSKELAAALDMTHDDLMELMDPQNINELEPVDQWSADGCMEKMTLPEGVLHKQLWKYEGLSSKVM